MCCQIIAIGIVALDRQFGYLASLGVQHKHIHIVTILCRQINLTVGQ